MRGAGRLAAAVLSAAVAGAPAVAAGSTTVGAPGPVEVLDFGVEELTFPVEELTFGSATLSGGVKEEGETITLAAEIFFAPNEHTRTPESEGELEALIGELQERDPARLTVLGHTDDVQDEDHNQRLSERRAQAIADEIASALGGGVDIEVSGRGESEPIADNETDAGRQLNRRVEVTVEG
ncbi:OmpA family protein [Zhihengliuella salsuginis]|uniref:OmpA-like domain-containing protein n=1 Tax=Zhihengliuella salsuginis TaxID=578222 RepID=A0ABQ3GFL5_9MICC|nr:OmpA family protein [Zhihengliuella salsuginis]GHD02940.1 hypothetical protein GCM10008096_08640 [Zhihengliuella salsuginis]